MEPLKVIIDTEFSDFINMDLISIGAAADSGHEFYAENLDMIKAWQSPWVKENIIPLLDLHKFGKKKSELAASLWQWLDELPCNEIVLIADYTGDFDLFNDLLQDKHPKVIAQQLLQHNIYKSCEEYTVLGTANEYGERISKVQARFDLVFKDYFDRTKEVQHHALSDAKAIREAYQKIRQEFKIK